MSDEQLKRPRGRPRKVLDDDAEPVTEIEYPDRIVMLRPYGYIDDDGNNRFWMLNQVVDDPDDIATIIDRGHKDWK